MLYEQVKTNLSWLGLGIEFELRFAGGGGHGLVKGTRNAFFFSVILLSIIISFISIIKVTIPITIWLSKRYHACAVDLYSSTWYIQGFQGSVPLCL